MMEFAKSVFTAGMLRPTSFEKEVHLIERRYDPLTGIPCRINTRRARRLKSVGPIDLSYLKSEDEDCPFCPHNIEQSTPLFPAKVLAEGKIEYGECRLFPNLFPLAEYHATATLTKEHFLDLDQFTTTMLVDNLRATKEFLLSVYQSNREAKYPIYFWNHLFTSAASIVHPHTQILVDRRPSVYQQMLLERSKEFSLKRGISAWGALIEMEKRQVERYIGENDSLSVIASFAPQGNREIQLIFKRIANLAELEENHLEDFADCLVRLLRVYQKMGVNSFNLSSFSGPIGEKLDYYSLHAKLISRPSAQPFYRNDTGILERIHYEADIEITPEAVAEVARELF
jgi:galactose-1-phosphate uridylyltransferase